MNTTERQNHESDPLLPVTNATPKKEDSVQYNSGLMVICLVAFTNGIIGLSDLSIQYMFKDDFDLSPASVSMIGSLTSLPWIIKPIWGFISDTYPIFGYRRKVYLGFFGVLAASGFAFLAFSVKRAWLTVLTLIIIQCSISFCNVIGEGLVVEETQRAGGSQEVASKYVSLFFGIRTCGTILTAYLSGAVLMYLPKQVVFGITAIFPLLLCCASFVLKEEKWSGEEETLNLVTQISEIKKFVMQREVGLPVLFILLIMAMPTAADAMFYFYTNELHFTPEFMGKMKLAYGIASLVAILLYNRYLTDSPFHSLFLITTILSMLFEGSAIIVVKRWNRAWHIPDEYFSLSNGFMFQAVAEINTMPLLVLCCRICPKNLEASLYALLMSTMNFGMLLSYQIGSLIMLILGITRNNFEKLWILNAITTIAYIFPLPLLKYIKADMGKKDGDDLI